MEMREMQKAAYKNKLEKGFNIKDINKEFCLLYGEVAEAYEAWRCKGTSVGEELADIVIYILGLAEILEVELQEEVERKIDINKWREYIEIDGVLQKKDAKMRDTERLERVWADVKELLRRECTALSFNTWIEPLEVLGITEINDERVVYLGWPESEKLILHINDHYLKSFEGCFNRVLEELYKVVVVPLKK